MSQMKDSRGTRAVIGLASGTPVVIASQSQDRVAIVIGCMGGVAAISYREATPNQGIVLVATSTLPLMMTLQDYGAILRGPIWAQGFGGSATIEVWEVFDCPCQY